MPKPETLNELRHLHNSAYGRPWPRHGIMLLHWFSNEYVSFDDDGDLVAKYNPERRKFSFHPFYDKLGGYDQLLPDMDWPFYEVGNLNKPTAGGLPVYVKENHSYGQGESNKDRIIVSVMDDLVIDKVYVTQHVDHSGIFDSAHTYCISKGLIKNIRHLTIEELKEKAGYYYHHCPSPRPNACTSCFNKKKTIPYPKLYY